ncbi:hypothetical protein D3C84_1216100 [compost metagenome]
MADMELLIQIVARGRQIVIQRQLVSGIIIIIQQLLLVAVVVLSILVLSIIIRDIQLVQQL